MGGPSKLRRAAKKIGFACALISRKQMHDDPIADNISSSREAAKRESLLEDEGASNGMVKNLCAICLDPLNSGQAIFTAQCSHAFHFLCISSNVHHGSITCPICRADWTELPHHLAPPHPLPCRQTDPILRILDDSIATFRVNRRSSLRSTRYDDDDPIDPDPTPIHPRLHLSLIPVPLPPSCFCPHGHVQVTQLLSHQLNDFLPCGHPTMQISPFTSHPITSSSSELLRNTTPSGLNPYLYSDRAYLSIKLTHPPAIDLVIVASTNGPHIRLLKQSMALVVFSLRSVDRLAIVTFSSTATRTLPLRRMSSQGKRAALQVIDRLFYLGQADQTEGLRKGTKILEDRAQRNPNACILLLSDSSTSSRSMPDIQIPVPVHRFRIGYGFGAPDGFVKHEFEEFLTRLLGGLIRDTQLRIGEKGRFIRLGELRGGEERRIPIELDDCGFVCVGYSYVESGVEECLRTGEMVVGIGEKGERSNGNGEFGGRDLSIGGRSSSVERWEHHDPCMARRWAKHLHGLL